MYIKQNMNVKVFFLLATLYSYFILSRAEIKISNLLSDQDSIVLKKFQVHENTIILTKDSRAMGAKYINETEVLSLEECLTWCWENNHCNVAVFEEQSKKSCFQFDCGSPTDFRCKFMRHKYFISSILKSTEHSYDLKHWGKDIKDEIGVATVKNLSTDSVPTMAAVIASTDAVFKSLPTTTPTSRESIRNEKSKCRHYQFQCLNSSECIAIYNVCDGIPQCPDGSDESRDLHCPNKNHPNLHLTDVKSYPTYTAHPTIAPVPKKEYVPHQAMAKPQLKELHQSSENADNGQFVHPSNFDDDKGPPLKNIKDMIAWPDGHQNNVDYDHQVDGSGRVHSPFTHKHSTFVAANNIQFPNKWPNDYDNMRYNQPSTLDQQYGPYEQRLDESYSKGQYPDYERTVYDTYRPEDNSLWADQDRLRNGIYLNDFPQVNIPVQNRPTMYSNQKNRFNSHSANSKIDTAGQYVKINEPLIKPAHHLHESMHQQLIPDQERFSMHQANRMQPHVYMPSEDMPQKNYGLYPDSQSQVLDIPDRSKFEGALISDREKALQESLSSQLQNSLSGKSVHMYEPIAEVPIYSTPVSIPKKTLINTMETTSVASPIPKTKVKVLQLNPVKLSAARFYEARAIRAHESNSAIVALILGLIVTGLLLLLVGCHLRTLKRRSARRGRQLAHDADYLVNGLYL